jgi:hypothetical protein
MTDRLTDDAANLWRRQSDCGCHVVGGGTVTAPLTVAHCPMHTEAPAMRALLAWAADHLRPDAGVTHVRTEARAILGRTEAPRPPEGPRPPEAPPRPPEEPAPLFPRSPRARPRPPETQCGSCFRPISGPPAWPACRWPALHARLA